MGELIYTIDEDRSREDKALAIKIQLAEKIDFSFKPVSPQPALTRDKLISFTTSRDAPLCAFLIREELAYIKRNSGRNFEDPKKVYDLVHVPYTLTTDAFKLLSSCGKLHFKSKPVVVDLFGKSEFVYHIDNGIASGYIKTETQEFPICEADCIGRGSPNWYIKGSSLKFITTDVTWTDFLASYQGKTRPYSELLEEAEEDPDAPRIHIKGNFIVPVNEPLPILILKDRLGSFADLNLAYKDASGTLIQEVCFHDQNQKIPGIKRQLHVEQGWEKDLLETGFTKKALDSSRYYCPLDKVAKSIAFLLELGWQVKDWRGNKVALYGKANLEVSETLNHITLKGKVQFDSFDADVTDIIGAFNRRERFAEIAPGHIALLPNSLEEIGLGDIAEAGEIIGKEIHVKNSCIGSLSGLFDSHLQITLDASASKLRDRILSFSGIEEALPGAGFIGTLRPYQQVGLNWLTFLYEFNYHGILADDMGLGKTVQVIAFLSRLSSNALPVLIVMPTSLIFNWKKELERFLPDAHVTIYHGSERNLEMDSYPKDKIHIILTTYTTARLDAQKLASMNYECLILDEAQAIKNASTQTAKTLSKFNSKFKLSITGTPIENHVMELWSHFNFLIPDLFGDEASFQAEVQAGGSDPRFMRRIKKMIRPFLLRRRKEDVAKDLPEKIEQVVWIPMQEKQRAIYEEFLSGVRKNLISKVNEDGSGKHRMEILEAIMRLRQICCHPLLVGYSGANAEAIESAKLNALMEDLDTAIEEGRKVLVYSQFTSMLGIISKELKERNIRFAYLDGSTKNRESVIESFQNDPSLQIFLLSLKAGGIGLNLTSADYVFLYDPWWNEAVENQAIDRAHRIGRKDTVLAKRYVIAESIEEKIMKLKSAKSALAADILDEEGATPGTLSMDDLLFLLSYD